MMMTETKLAFKPFPAGVTTFWLEDVAAIRIRVRDQRTYTYKGRYGNLETDTPWRPEAARSFFAHLAHIKGKLVKCKRDTTTSITIVLKDGRELPNLEFWEHELQAFWQGQPQPPGFGSKAACYNGWQVDYVLMSEERGQMARLRVTMPREILQAAIAQVPKIAHSTTSGTYRLAERHVKYWKPSVRVEMPPEALAIYKANWNVAKAGETNLREQMCRLVNIARNGSRNQRQPGRLRLYAESPRSFGWSAQTGTGKPSMHGGLIFHGDRGPNDERLETGYYSIHT